MLKKRLADFAEQVWIAASRVGRNSGKIADEILEPLFPATVSAAEHEGATSMLRNGVISAVKSVLHRIPEDERQMSLNDIAPGLVPFVEPLKRPSYWVNSRGEEVVIAELIADPALLDDARKFMRQKGEECIAEADRLDQLYAAVTADA